MTTFDPTKPVRTRDGRKARIVAAGVKAVNDYTILCIVENPDGTESPVALRSDGRVGMYSNSGFDLVNVPMGGTKWLNIWSTGPGDASSYNSRALADKAAADNKAANRPQKRLACVSVDWEEGQGL